MVLVRGELQVGEVRRKAAELEAPTAITAEAEVLVGPMKFYDGRVDLEVTRLHY